MSIGGLLTPAASRKLPASGQLLKQLFQHFNRSGGSTAIIFYVDNDTIAYHIVC